MKLLDALVAVALALSCVRVHSHAEFFMADSSYRKDSQGRMYCHAPMNVGDNIMGKAMVESSDYGATFQNPKNHLCFTASTKNKTEGSDHSSQFPSHGFHYPCSCAHFSR